MTTKIKALSITLSVEMDEEGVKETFENLKIGMKAVTPMILKMLEENAALDKIKEALSDEHG